MDVDLEEDTLSVAVAEKEHHTAAMEEHTAVKLMDKHITDVDVDVDVVMAESGPTLIHHQW